MSATINGTQAWGPRGVEGACQLAKHDRILTIQADSDEKDYLLYAVARLARSKEPVAFVGAEALDMAKSLIGAITRGDVDQQYHLATLIQLDALARGAKGPEPDERQQDIDRALDEFGAAGEDASEEARR